MTEPFLGEIRMFAGNFAPRGWAFCDGQLLQISQNDALFSLFGTIYGGDGETSFALPDLRGRVPIHQGQGAGLSNRRLGGKGGTENETLTVPTLPSHTHAMQGSSATGNAPNPQGNQVASVTAGDLYINGNPEVALHSNSISNVGGSQSHDNMMPFLAIHFIVALSGIFPSRS